MSINDQDGFDAGEVALLRQEVAVRLATPSNAFKTVDKVEDDVIDAYRRGKLTLRAPSIVIADFKEALLPLDERELEAVKSLLAGDSFFTTLGSGSVRVRLADLCSVVAVERITRTLLGFLRRRVSSTPVVPAPARPEAPEYSMSTPGRWFAWLFRRVETAGKAAEPRVLAWRCGLNRWDVVSREMLSEGDYWLPLPGRPDRDSSPSRYETLEVPLEAAPIDYDWQF